MKQTVHPHTAAIPILHGVHRIQGLACLSICTNEIVV